MRRRTRLLFLLSAATATATTSATTARAEEVPEAAFVNVINLVCLREPTHVALDDFAFNGGEPVAAGERSGLVAIVPGRHLLTLSNREAKPDSVSVPVDLENGKTVVVICYDETKEFDDGSRETKLRAEVLVEGEKSGPRLSLVSILPEPFVGIEIGDESITLTPRRAHAVEVALGAVVKIRHGGRVLAEVSMAKACHTIGFLYRKPSSGAVALSLVSNEKLEYEAPLDRDGPGEAADGD